MLLVNIFVSIFADDPNRLPTKCESNDWLHNFFLNKLLLFILKACKYLTNELSESLLKHNSHDIIETGYSLDDRLNKKNPKKYRDS